MHATLAAVEHFVRARSPHGWWLGAVWRFTDTANQALFVLTRGPLSIFQGNPLVLNHTSADHPLEIAPHEQPDMAFMVVPAAGSLEIHWLYPLPPVDLRSGQTVVAKFAVGRERPQSEWKQGHTWEAVKRWQSVLESEPLILDSGATDAIA